MHKIRAAIAPALCMFRRSFFCQKNLSSSEECSEFPFFVDSSRDFRYAGGDVREAHDLFDSAIPRYANAITDLDVER